MRTIQASSGKVLFTILMVVVVIALAAGAGIYFQVIPIPTQPEPQPVATRHKIAVQAGQTTSAPPAVLEKPAEPAAPTAMGNDSNRASDIAAPAPDVDPSSVLAGPGPDTNRSPAAFVTDGPEVAVHQPSPDQLSQVGPGAESAATPHDGAETAATEPENKTDVTPAPAVLPLPPIESSPLPAGAQATAAVSEEEKRATSQGFYTIQVGAFRSKDNARSKLGQTRQLGFEADIVEIMDAQQAPWYTVRFGHYDTRNQARAALAAYRQKENKPAVIIAPD